MKLFNCVTVVLHCKYKLVSYKYNSWCPVNCRVQTSRSIRHSCLNFASLYWSAMDIDGWELKNDKATVRCSQCSCAVDRRALHDLTSVNAPAASQSVSLRLSSGQSGLRHRWLVRSSPVDSPPWSVACQFDWRSRDRQRIKRQGAGWVGYGKLVSPTLPTWLLRVADGSSDQISRAGHYCNSSSGYFNR